MKKILLMATVALAGLTACESPATESATRCEASTITLKDAFEQLSKVGLMDILSDEISAMN